MSSESSEIVKIDSVVEPIPSAELGHHDDWKAPLDNAKIPISCQILPTGVLIFLVVVLLAVSTFSWVFFGGKMGLLTGIVPLFVLPLLIGAASNLRISLDRRGLVAQNGFHQDMLYDRTTRPWADLHSVRLRHMRGSDTLLSRLGYRGNHRLKKPGSAQKLLHMLGCGWKNQGFIVFDFKSGGIVAFPLGGFNAKNLENLFIAVSRYTDPIVLNPDVIALQREVLSGAQMYFGESYTRMWEASLAERFEVTNFVPLEGGMVLRGGDLTVMMLLTCGGMSSVYLVRDREGRRLVLKELSVPFDEGSGMFDKVQEMFVREAALLGRLKHQHIVSVLDCFVERGRHYLLLEFVPGLTLRQHVQMSGPFSTGEVIEIALQVSDILSYLHCQSPPVVHRDVTPDNLIISENERQVTLVDFGAATEFVGSLTGTLIGKQCYIPPEQFQGQSNPQSDIYALGCTMYYLLTGSDPEPIASSRPQSGSDILDDLIEKCTAQNYSDRPENADYLTRQLKAIKVV